MTQQRIYSFSAFISFLLLSFVLVCHFRIYWLPLACLALGFFSRLILPSRHLELFSFLIPVLPAFAVLESYGFPLHYLLLPLFFLCGIVAGELACGRGKISPPLPSLPRFYLYFLLLLAASFFFVMLRWSNLTLSPLAIFRNTPVAPSLQRLSFAIIFPVVEIASFALSPLYFLLLKRSASRRGILVAFLCGQALSIAFSFYQRLQDIHFGMPVKGLASDETAFGFLSALAVLLAWYLYRQHDSPRLGFIFAAVSVLGILNSATRVSLLALAAVMLLFVLSGRGRKIPILALGALLAGSLAFYAYFFYRPGSNLFTRIHTDYLAITKSLQLKSVENAPLLGKADSRNILWHYSLKGLRRFPFTGVGTGNFVFWVMALDSKGFYHHLPANQYFFIASSTGLIGLLLFLLFCFGLFRGKPRPEKWLLAIFLFLLIFNDYLWFPEIFLAFWLFAVLGDGREDPSRLPCKWAKWLYGCGFSLFIIFQFVNFAKLHPKNWARETAMPYDYGFSYLEADGDRSFRWSGAKAGAYVFLAKNDPKFRCQLTCGAPLSFLPEKKQTVDVYWRGKRIQQVVFRENGVRQLLIEDSAHGEGFLEFRVQPTFNLKKMGLGTEFRDLGVQVSAPFMLADPESRAIVVNVETIEERRNEGSRSLYIQGWIFVKDMDCRGQKVYVQLEKPGNAPMSFLASPMTRPDVGSSFKNALYTDSGFNVLIPLPDGWDARACAMRFVVQNRNGRYKSPVWREGGK